MVGDRYDMRETNRTQFNTGLTEFDTDRTELDEDTTELYIDNSSKNYNEIFENGRENVHKRLVR